MNIVFDLDGTLIDSAPDLQAAASKVLERLGKDPLSLDETRRFIGQGAGVFVGEMMSARDIAASTELHASLLEEFLELYELAVDKASYYPGVQEVLDTLHNAGHGLALCTNKPERPARAVIRHMDMEHIFEVVVAGGMLSTRKPEPDMLLKAVSDLGGRPAVFVGDSEIDAETARRAGIAFALYTGGYRKTSVAAMHHDWAFDDFLDLPTIITDAAERV